LLPLLLLLLLLLRVVSERERGDVRRERGVLALKTAREAHELVLERLGLLGDERREGARRCEKV